MKIESRYIVNRFEIKSKSWSLTVLWWICEGWICYIHTKDKDHNWKLKKWYHLKDEDVVRLCKKYNIKLCSEEILEKDIHFLYAMIPYKYMNKKQLCEIYDTLVQEAEGEDSKEDE